MDLLFEVNTSGENTKHGIERDDELRILVERSMTLRHVRARGLMTIGPFNGTEDQNRRAFARLRGLFEDCQRRFSPLHWNVLSMGMSGDFKIAIEEGSTMVRIGTAIFGQRSYFPGTPGNA